MTLQQVFSDAYLTRMASQVIHQSLIDLENDQKELQENADYALSLFEPNGAPIEVLDELYLATL